MLVYVSAAFYFCFKPSFLCEIFLISILLILDLFNELYPFSFLATFFFSFRENRSHLNQVEQIKDGSFEKNERVDLEIQIYMHLCMYTNISKCTAKMWRTCTLLFWFHVDY